MYGLNLKPAAGSEPQGGPLDLVSLGGLVHRLDPGIIPFRKATDCAIHVSGGEFNVAANLADCFRLKTGVASAMVDYPVGDLIAQALRLAAPCRPPADRLPAALTVTPSTALLPVGQSMCPRAVRSCAAWPRWACCGCSTTPQLCKRRCWTPRVAGLFGAACSKMSFDGTARNPQWLG